MTSDVPTKRVAQVLKFFRMSDNETHVLGDAGLHLDLESYLHLAKNINYFYDDFVGDLIDDKWAVSNAAAGGEVDFAIVTNENGAIEGTTGSAAADRWVQVDFGAFLNYSAGLNCGIEARLQIDNITSVEIDFGFYKDADEYAWFMVDLSAKTDASIYCQADGGAGANTDTDSGTDIVANTYITLRVQCKDDGSVEYYIDGTLVRTDPATTVATTGQLMGPYFRINNETTSARKATIDYIEIWQDRS